MWWHSQSSMACITITEGRHDAAPDVRMEKVASTVVQECASDTARARPAAIWLGSRLLSSLFPRVDITVRFNDIVGNAQGGCEWRRT